MFFSKGVHPKVTFPDDGSMSGGQREHSLDKLKSSKSIQCILVSFKAGGLGEWLQSYVAT